MSLYFQSKTADCNCFRSFIETEENPGYMTSLCMVNILRVSWGEAKTTIMHCDVLLRLQGSVRQFASQGLRA